MVALALNYGKGISLLKSIARQEGISEKYLGQIIIPLKAGDWWHPSGALTGAIPSRGPLRI